MKGSSTHAVRAQAGTHPPDPCPSPRTSGGGDPQFLPQYSNRPSLLKAPKPVLDYWVLSSHPALGGLLHPSPAD